MKPEVAFGASLRRRGILSDLLNGSVIDGSFVDTEGESENLGVKELRSDSKRSVPACATEKVFYRR